MRREPYNILVLPYINEESGETRFCMFKRKSDGVWQFAEGGVFEGETPAQAAYRNMEEKSGHKIKGFQRLVSRTYVPTCFFEESENVWKGIHVIPLYCFAAEMPGEKMSLSEDYAEYKWVSFEEALDLLAYDIDKTIMYELKAILE